ncbi:TOBE domain-containing protein [Sulfurospirillum sp. 1307]|jgi:molybdate transport system regulatory protein
MQSDILNLSNPQNLEKKIKLLESIEKCGSISKAAKEVPISYKLAWEMLDNMNNLSSKPIVLKAVGGSGGGGTKLTSHGKELIKSYYILKDKYDAFLQNISKIDDLKTLQKLAISISARNQLLGKIIEIKNYKVSSDVVFELKSGVRLCSTITHEAVMQMDLKVGDEIVGIIKASSVYIANEPTKNINNFKASIDDIQSDEGIAKIALHVNNTDKIWLTCKSYLIDELSLKVNKEVYIFIQPKNILIGR